MGRIVADDVLAKKALHGPLSKPALIKLGGSILTEKHGDGKFRKPVAKRLLGEIQKANMPIVLVHGAGSFGHPEAKKHALGRKQATTHGVAETLAAVGLLHSEMIALSAAVGLNPISIPLHFEATSEGDQLLDLPVGRIERLLEEGFMPVLHGTLVRDDTLGWRIASGDEILAEIALELDPRLAVYATDVDGVFAPHATAPDAQLLSTFGPSDLDLLGPGDDEDATGAMLGKLERALSVAAACPTWIVNGNERGRVHDLLMGKTVPGTRIATS